MSTAAPHCAANRWRTLVRWRWRLAWWLLARLRWQAPTVVMGEPDLTPIPEPAVLLAQAVLQVPTTAARVAVTTVMEAQAVAPQVAGALAVVANTVPVLVLAAQAPAVEGEAMVSMDRGPLVAVAAPAVA